MTILSTLLGLFLQFPRKLRVLGYGQGVECISVIYLVSRVVNLSWGLRPFYRLSLAFLLHPRFHLCIIAEIVMNVTKLGRQVG